MQICAAFIFTVLTLAQYVQSGSDRGKAIAEIFASHAVDAMKEASGQGHSISGKDKDGVSAADFLCPGIGTYAVKKPGKENCKKYYICPTANRKAVSLRKCNKDENFNRLSRKCEDEEYVNCKWCAKEGRHADITSKSHFLECVPGSVAIRYKCKEGEFDAKKKECIEKDWKITDLTLDVELDPPEDIVKFQKKWAKVEDDKKAKSIEELGSESKKDKKKKKKDSGEESTTAPDDEKTTSKPTKKGRKTEDK